MQDEIHADILRQCGFIPIGTLDYRLRLTIWWNPENKIQLIVFSCGPIHLLKATKDYYMKSISEQGQTWARDVRSLHDYLENHFRELHLSFSYVRDITPSLAAMQAKSKLPEEFNTSNDKLLEIQSEYEAKKSQQEGIEGLISLDNGSSSLLSTYMKNKKKTLRHETRNLKEQAIEQKKQLSLYNNLQREYLEKGSASTLVFSLSSNIHVTDSPMDFDDAVKSVVKELRDMHRFEVTQKLCGGKLNIHVSEANEPTMTWLEEWLGGCLTPKQMEKVDKCFTGLSNANSQYIMVTADEDITLNGETKECKKLMAAKIFSSLTDCLDDHDQQPKGGSIAPENLPATVGRLVNKNRLGEQCEIPLASLNNVYISGSTGSGKSYAGRVIVEEASKYDGLNILILDPRNQAAGLLVPEDRPKILSLYKDFNLPEKSARGYDFNYYGSMDETPDDLAELGRGRNIVSFKGLDDKSRCVKFKEILDAVFEDYAREESDTLKLLVIIEEAQNFTRKRGSEDAKEAGRQAENALDRMTREIRKYGGCVIIQSQTIRDFSYDSASIRQNTNTKIFLHNSDREVEYAANFIGDGRQIIQLDTAEAILYNPGWGAKKAKIRPPYSKVWEFSERDTQKIINNEIIPQTNLSTEALELLKGLEQYYNLSSTPLNLSRIGDVFNITSKRKIQLLVSELEKKGFIKTRSLSERGRPRVIELIQSTAGLNTD